VHQDTSPEAFERYYAMLRAASPEERLRAAISLSSTVRALAEAGIRMRQPQADDREVRVRLAVRLYGREAALRLFGAIPEDAI
jgi:hypothetical protein